MNPRAAHAASSLKGGLGAIGGVLAILLLCLPAMAGAPTVNLPDSGTYYWWVSSASGSVASPPKATTGASHFSAALTPGETLYVLDTHTGEVAGVPVASATGAISLKFADFHAIGGVSAPAAAAKTGPPAPAPAATATPASTSAGGGAGDVMGRIISWLFDIIVIGVLVWFGKRLVDTRGRLLIQGARKLGVDVPDPEEIAAQAAAEYQEGVYSPPPARDVEKVPEEVLAAAGVPPTANGWGSATQDTAPHLVGLDGPTRGQRFDLTSTGASVGREAGNEIVIADPSVSRRHAFLEQRGTVFVLRDDGSANGVFVNGQKVDEQPLRTGDTVQIGRIRFRYDNG